MKLFSLSMLLCCMLATPSVLALDVGDQLPALEITTLNGKTIDFGKLRGSVIVLNLWASWCTPCRAEMPILENFYQTYRDRKIVVLGLSEDDSSDADTVRQIMQDYTYPAALAADASKNGMRTPRILPVTYVIDTHGVIRAKLWGGGQPVTAMNLAAAVEPLLSKPDQS